MPVRLLDAFCKAGGCTEGYVRAGFDEAVGVDIKAQPRYRGDFVLGDAIEFIREHGREFDVIHASPPCQRYSQATSAGAWRNHPDLLGLTREALIATGRPYIIENVPRAPLRDATVLCGTMFELQADDEDGTRLYLKRHRLFESNVALIVPKSCAHPRSVQWAGSYGGARRDKDEARHVRHGGYVPSAKVQSALLGIDWMTEPEMYEAIPPVYTEWLGRQLLEAARR